jgi:hypothetical protein
MSRTAIDILTYHQHKPADLAVTVHRNKSRTIVLTRIGSDLRTTSRQALQILSDSSFICLPVLICYITDVSKPWLAIPKHISYTINGKAEYS